MKETSFKREAESEADNEEEGPHKRIFIRLVCGQRSTPISTLCCQADECSVNLSFAKRYHRSHKVCERHFKSPVVLVAGIRQRFCQQCSRFHEISQFDDTKRSCRKRLAGHNERRRKTQSDLQEEDRNYQYPK